MQIRSPSPAEMERSSFLAQEITTCWSPDRTRVLNAPQRQFRYGFHMKVTPCSPDSENHWGGFEHNATAHAACQTQVLPRTPVPIAKPRLWRQKAPPPLLPPCHLSAEGKRVASPRLLTHTHKPRNTSTKKRAAQQTPERATRRPVSRGRLI